MDFALNFLRMVHDWLDLDFWEALLVALLLAGLYLLLKISRSKDSPYNMRDAMVDDATGKASFRKLAGLVSLIATTWAFCRMTAYGTLAEWYAQLYFLTWALVLMVPRLADSIADVVKSIFGKYTGLSAGAAPAPQPVKE